MEEPGFAAIAWLSQRVFVKSSEIGTHQRSLSGKIARADSLDDLIELQLEGLEDLEDALDLKAEIDSLVKATPKMGVLSNVKRTTLGALGVQVQVVIDAVQANLEAIVERRKDLSAEPVP